MSKNNDYKDPLEQFFRKKVEEYDISYQEKDWLSLEQKLDQQQAIRMYKKRIRWAVAASLLIVTTLGYFTYENYIKINEMSHQQNDNRITDITPDLSKEPTPELLSSPSNENNDEKEPTDVPQQDQVQLALAEDNRPTPAAKEVFDSNQKDVDLRDFRDRYPEDLITVSRVEADVRLPSVSDNDLFTDRKFHAQSVRLGSPTGRFLQEPKRSLASRLSFGIVFSPDLSTAGKLSNFDTPGYKYGLTLGYEITPDLSLSTGVVQSKVRYTSDRNSYNASVYWQNSIAPNHILAECIILDIPVNIQYNFMHQQNSRFFTTAGLSTYIMLNEDYQFDYDNYSAGQISKKNVRSGKTHLMSNIGFSLGYEMDVHQNWSLRVEPFIKVPIQNVGWINMKLYSLGSFFSIQYKL